MTIPENAGRLAGLIVEHGPYEPYAVVPMEVQRFIESEQLNALRDDLLELADLRVLFQMQHDRMAEATQRWRAEAPEARALTLPDLGALLRWLMDDADQARGVAGAPHAARREEEARRDALRFELRRVGSGPRAAGEHVNCEHDPEGADGNPFAAMICSPCPDHTPGGAT